MVFFLAFNTFSIFSSSSNIFERISAGSLLEHNYFTNILTGNGLSLPTFSVIGWLFSFDAEDSEDKPKLKYVHSHTVTTVK